MKRQVLAISALSFCVALCVACSFVKPQTLGNLELEFSPLAPMGATQESAQRSRAIFPTTTRYQIKVSAPDFSPAIEASGALNPGLRQSISLPGIPVGSGRVVELKTYDKLGVLLSQKSQTVQIVQGINSLNLLLVPAGAREASQPLDLFNQIISPGGSIVYQLNSLPYGEYYAALYAGEQNRSSWLLLYDDQGAAVPMEFDGYSWRIQLARAGSYYLVAYVPGTENSAYSFEVIFYANNGEY